jgi:hypothetical protein
MATKRIAVFRSRTDGVTCLRAPTAQFAVQSALTQYLVHHTENNDSDNYSTAAAQEQQQEQFTTALMKHLRLCFMTAQGPYTMLKCPSLVASGGLSTDKEANKQASKHVQTKQLRTKTCGGRVGRGCCSHAVVVLVVAAN